MGVDVEQNGEAQPTITNKESTYGLSTVPTSITLSPEQFERMYLSPMVHRQGSVAKQVGNPTPLALGGFVITTTPLACCLMAWRGASGNGIAFTGPITFLGGMLLVIGSILEFILGNTFPCVFFGTIGAFWFAFAATMIPAFNAAASYSATTGDTNTGLLSPDFMNTYAFLFVSMGALMFIFMVCATRTNVVLTLVFLSLLMVFAMLTAAYWRLGLGDAVVGNRCVVGGGAALFAASMLGFYLLIVQLFGSMDFPFELPVGDLSHLWEPSLRKQRQRQFEASDSNN